MIILSLFSCNEHDNNEARTDTGLTTIPEEKFCYAYLHNNDTIILQILTIGDSISGTLINNLFEKDKNIGTVSGKINNDIIIGTYTFLSEGTESVRPIAFKKQDNNMVEGYGSINNALHFTDTVSLDFSNSYILKNYTCE